MATMDLRSGPSWRARAAVRPLAFFGLVYLATWLWIGPELIYYGFWISTAFPVFSTDRAFLQERLAFPGGAVDWLAALLCQSFHSAWLGAAVITAGAALLVLAAYAYLASLARRRPTFLHYVPALMVLLLFARYVNALPAAVALLTVAALAGAYARIPANKSWARGALFVALGATAYYLAGGAFLVFGALCTLYEISSRKWLTGAVCLAATAAVPYVAGAYVFHVRPLDSWWRLLPVHPESDVGQPAAVALLFASLPAVAAAVVLRPHGWPARERGRAWQRALGRVAPLAPIGPFALAAVILAVSYSPTLRSLYRIEYCSCHGMWAKLLQEAHRLPAAEHNLFVKWDVNRALFHTRRLPSEMFSYPQHPLGLAPGYTAFTELNMKFVGWSKLAGIMADLGQLNEAERLTYEVMELSGDRPAYLRLVSMIETAKGERDAARILLGALRTDPVNARYARQGLRRLKDESMAGADPEVQRMRSVMLKEDGLGRQPFETMMLQLLDANPHNRMAFEYLMAHYLLNRDLDGLARNIHRLSDLDYAEIPRHYEEALVLYGATMGWTPRVPGRMISPETVRRFEEFRRILTGHGRDVAGARRELAGAFGNSYFFYATFGSSGEGR